MAVNSAQTRTVAARGAEEFAEEVSEKLLTLSSRPVDVVGYAATHGAIAGHFVTGTDLVRLTITTEEGWTVRYDGSLGRRGEFVLVD